MNIINYKTLISELPVRQQSFITKRSTWRKAENEFDWLVKLNNKIFENQETINISRQDIFDSNGMERELILKTIYWGYTRGMRGNHFMNIMRNIKILETTFKELVNKNNPSGSDFDEMTKVIKNIPGIHLSTYSKLLYFFKIKFNGDPCLILDQRLIDVFNSGVYNEYALMEKTNDYNKEAKYLTYLELTHQLATTLNTKGENIEQFLFMFGNNLKINK